MKLRAVVYVVGMVMALVAGVAIGGWGSDREERTNAGGPEPRYVRLGDGDLQLVGLVTEDSCPDLLGWLKERAKAGQTEYFGGGGMVGDSVGAERSTAAPLAATSGDEALPSGATASANASRLSAGSDFSTTNVQEAGVDEPDLVKTDGVRLVTIASGHLRVVDVSTASPKLVSSLPLENVAAQSLFLVGDRVMVFGGVFSPVPRREGAPVPMPMPVEPGVAVDSISPGHYGGFERTAVLVVDISDAAAPKVTSRVELDGGFLSARLIDGVARLVLRSVPAWMARGVDVDSTDIDAWLPTYQYAEPGREEATVNGPIVECDRVHHPVDARDTSMVTVVSIDPEDARPGNAATVAGAGETVYASGARLYVSSSRWTNDSAQASTDIHAFDISDKVTTRYVGSGAVAGTLLNQFSLSEHDGYLRVATTTFPDSGDSESQVVVLELRDGGIHVVGSVGGLGKTEQIYAVRFLGDLGYVVTFRQTDPLYVIDLSTPAAPVLRGELKIPGFSSYLHPIGDGRLLGIGQNATDEGRRLGSQISLFDVSDPSAPKQLSTFPLGAFSSEAEYDHHAFLWWAPSSLAVVPVDVGRAVGVRVDGSSLVRHGGDAGLAHPTGYPIRRSLVVGSSLLTVSESGVSSVRLDDFGGSVWTAF